MNDYEEKKQARIDRYREYAQKARQESNVLGASASEMISVIPMGQPIHGDKDRKYREKAFNKTGKSVEAQKKADYYESKAEAAENNHAISSDDPEALDKLKAKLDSLETHHAHMVMVNAYYRKHGTCIGCAGLNDERAKEIDKSIQDTEYSWLKIPYSSSTLALDNADIRRIKQRIAELERNKEIGFVGWEFHGGKVEANNSINRLQIFFDEKPDEEIRKELKGNGFRWSPNEKAWQRQLNKNALYGASRVVSIQPKDGRSVFVRQPKAVPKKTEPTKGQETGPFTEPKQSPWGEIQNCDVLCTGVFQVTTAGHGGTMVSKDMLALLSPAALNYGMKFQGYKCYEEDTEEKIVLRELLDKKLWSIPERVKDKTAFEENINEALKVYHPDYWRTRQQGIEKKAMLIKAKKQEKDR